MTTTTTMTLAPPPSAAPPAVAITEEQVALAKRTVAPDLNPDEFSLFLYECHRRGTHPLDRRIIPMVMSKHDRERRRLSFITSIDYLRSRAESTGQYAGSDDAVFTVAPKLGPFPEDVVATVTVHRLVGGHLAAFTASARLKQYSTGQNLWSRMPHVMLAKCAEALALRKGFPDALAGLYTSEELSEQNDSMMQAPPTPYEDEEPVTRNLRDDRPAPAAPPESKPIAVISLTQRQRLAALASKMAWTTEQVSAMLAEFGFSNSAAITPDAYPNIVARLELGPSSRT